MIEFKHEDRTDEEGIENLLDLVFSPSRINLSSYSLRKKFLKLKHFVLLPRILMAQ